jgi:hypothetical protein
VSAPLLSGAPPLAISYQGLIATLDRAGWDVTMFRPSPDRAGFQLHGEHRRRVEASGKPQRCSIIVSQHVFDDQDWLHASIYLGDQTTPTHEDMTMLHRAVFGRRRHAWQCFVPADQHVNLKEVLHLYGRVDGRNVLPDFRIFGQI